MTIKIDMAYICNEFGIRPKMRMSAIALYTIPWYASRETREGCAF